MPSNAWVESTLIKKENKIFTIYKEIQKGVVAYMPYDNGLLIYVWLNICAFPQILGSPRRCNRSHLNFLMHEENCLFFFISVEYLPVPRAPGVPPPRQICLPLRTGAEQCSCPAKNDIVNFLIMSSSIYSLGCNMIRCLLSLFLSIIMKENLSYRQK